jgi:hypothetical protein
VAFEQRRRRGGDMDEQEKQIKREKERVGITAH